MTGWLLGLSREGGWKGVGWVLSTPGFTTGHHGTDPAPGASAVGPVCLGAPAPIGAPWSWFPEQAGRAAHARRPVFCDRCGSSRASCSAPTPPPCVMSGVSPGRCISGCLKIGRGVGGHTDPTEGTQGGYLFIQSLRRGAPPQGSTTATRQSQWGDGPVKGERALKLAGGRACQGGVPGPRHGDVSPWAGPTCPGADHPITERGRGRPGARGCLLRAFCVAAGPGAPGTCAGPGVGGSARPCASRRLRGSFWRWPGLPGRSPTWGRQEALGVRPRVAGTSLWGVWWQDRLSEVPPRTGVGVPGSRGAGVPGCWGPSMNRCQGSRIPPRRGPRVPGVGVPGSLSERALGCGVLGCWGPRVQGCWGPRVLGSFHEWVLGPLREPILGRQVLGYWGPSLNERWGPSANGSRGAG